MPDGYPVAYCAPGQRFAAALILMLKGEQVARIEEHPWVEGANVIVISEPPLSRIRRELGLFRFAHRPVKRRIPHPSPGTVGVPVGRGGVVGPVGVPVGVAVPVGVDVLVGVDVAVDVDVAVGVVLGLGVGQGAALAESV